ncbi:MAG: hypothetical protein WA706_26105, partial [Pseudolabrys sp.]
MPVRRLITTTITTIVTAGGATAIVTAVGDNGATQHFQFLVKDELARANAARPVRVSSVGFHPACRSFV